MRLTSLQSLAVALTVAGTVGCGGGGGGGSGGGAGSLSFRALWEQPARGRDAFGGIAAAQGVPITRASFGPELPAAVKTIRIRFNSDNGRSCCLAVDPTRLPTDPASGRRFLVLAQLPGGPATVMLAGFATDFAPSEGFLDMCAIEPAGAGQPCDPSPLATPSFLSDPRQVTIVTGTETDAGEIRVFSVPFLLDPSPAVGSSVANPVSFSFTVGDAAEGVDSGSVAADVAQGGGSASGLPLALSACDDASNTPCSTGGALGVTGFHVAGGTRTLGVGRNRMRVRARNLAPASRALDFTYPFEVRAAAPVTPSPTPAPAVITVRPGANIAEVAKRAPAGSTLILAPGVYAPVILNGGDLAGALTLLADVTGLLTNSSAADVVINARGRAAAIGLSEQTGVTIDGVTLQGGTDAGLLVARSGGIAIRNCIISGTAGDGVRFDGSDGGLLFNNLISAISGTGIRVVGTNDLRVINNTVYKSGDTGIFVGDVGTPSHAVVVENNILNLNVPTGIVADASTSGYEADFNLNTDGFGADTPIGVHDITPPRADPLFIAPTIGDFRLAKGIAGSTSAAVDAGDPQTDEALVDALGQRTTQTDGTLDIPPVDLGYHFLAPVPPAGAPPPGP